MVRIEKSIEIKAPPEKVWEMLALDRWPEWMEEAELKSAKYTSEVRTPEDKYRVGASAHMTEKRWEFDLNVIESLENEKMTVRSKESEWARARFVLQATFILQSIEEGTKLTSLLNYEMPWGIFGKFLEKLFVQRMEEKQGQRVLEKLKSILEK